MRQLSARDQNDTEIKNYRSLYSLQHEHLYFYYRENIKRVSICFEPTVYIYTLKRPKIKILPVIVLVILTVGVCQFLKMPIIRIHRKDRFITKDLETQILNSKVNGFCATRFLHH